MKNLRHFITALCVSVLFTNCGSKSAESTENSDSTAQSPTEPTTTTSAWQIANIKDEFGDIIKGKSTIAADFKGKMANSATVDADLTVRMQIAADSTILTIFYEYSREPQAKLPENEFINAKVKLGNGEVITVKQFFYQNMMVDGDKKLFNLLLKESNPIKVIVDLSTLGKSETTVYNFEIDPSGLENILKAKTK